MQEPITISLTASRIGAYFEKMCQRNLFVETVAKKDRINQLGILEKPGGDSSTAWAGEKWEAELLDRLVEDEENNKSTKVLYCDGDKSKKYSYEQTLDILRNLDTNKPLTTYVSQSCITVEKNTDFYEKYLRRFEIKGVNLGFSDRMYPDFLCLEFDHSKGKYRITVIDVKGADHLKAGAQVQIALYTLIIKSILKFHKIDNCYINEEYGVVWNKEPLTKKRLDHEFSLKEAYCEIDNFFDNTLMDVCEKIANSENGMESIDSMDCMVSAQCAYCICYDTCLNRMKQSQNARLLPYISRLAQEKMNKLISLRVLKDDSIDSLKQYLSSNNTEGLTENCSFWKKVKNDLTPVVDGFEAFCNDSQEVFYKHGSTLGFPTYQDFALILTAQRDVDSGRCYAYAWWLSPGQNLDIYNIGLNDNGFVDVHYSKDNKKGENLYYGAIIARTNTEEEFDRIDKEFVDHISDILYRIGEMKNKTLQIYLMGAYEEKNLELALYNILENLDSVNNQEYMEKVMTILFWLQGENMITEANSQPGEIVDNPVSIINSEVQKLYVLPEGIAYNLRNISKSLSPDFNFEGNDEVYFEKLSDVMDGMPFVRMCEAYNLGDYDLAKSRLNAMKSHIIMRMNVEKSIIDRIHRDSKASLVRLANRAGIYQNQVKIHEGYEEIARLSFENKYEELLKYHRTRGVRLSGVDNAISEGDILSAEYIGENRYKVINYDKYAGNEWFSSLICEDTEYNRIQIMMFRDVIFETNWQSGCFNTRNESGEDVPTFYASDFDMKFEFNVNGEAVTLTYKVKKDSDFNPVVGRKYLIFERYTNFNSRKTEEGLVNLKSRLELINPQLLVKDTKLKWNEEIRSICSKYWSPDKYEFSDSQLEAFIHLVNRSLTVLVGPPAAGKTDLIARAVLTLANYYMEKEHRGLNVLISANSHSAIDNVLAKILKMQNQAFLKYTDDRFEPIACFKMNKLDEVNKGNVYLEDVTIASEKHIYRDIEDTECDINIVGATCWSLYKADDCNYDLIIIDEASQVRAMDAPLILSQSNRDTRFLLVGDDDQLPPIISGKYKIPEEGKYIHGSIFKLYLSALGKGHKDIIQLNDNFRMNNILCRYSAKKIYGDEYHAPLNNKAIGTQKISLKNSSSDLLLSELLDEDYPLVFCQLSGTASEQREAEVKLVSSLVKELSLNDMNPDGSLSFKKGNFWDEKSINDIDYDGACGIISPHHEHINKLRSAVARELGCQDRDIYIGTVDKLQGKERRNIIVSYGVYDKETIEKESEFIFSRNRFNVSLTRGKAKTIVFLSDVIAQSSLTTNNLKGTSDEVNKGIDFVQGFAEYMKIAEAGEDMKHSQHQLQGGNVLLNIWKKKIDDSYVETL